MESTSSSWSCSKSCFRALLNVKHQGSYVGWWHCRRKSPSPAKGGRNVFIQDLNITWPLLFSFSEKWTCSKRWPKTTPKQPNPEVPFAPPFHQRSWAEPSLGWMAWWPCRCPHRLHGFAMWLWPRVTSPGDLSIQMFCVTKVAATSRRSRVARTSLPGTKAKTHLEFSSDINLWI